MCNKNNSAAFLTKNKYIIINFYYAFHQFYLPLNASSGSSSSLKSRRRETIPNVSPAAGAPHSAHKTLHRKITGHIKTKLNSHLETTSRCPLLSTTETQGYYFTIINPLNGVALTHPLTGNIQLSGLLESFHCRSLGEIKNVSAIPVRLSGRICKSTSPSL